MVWFQSCKEEWGCDLKIEGLEQDENEVDKLELQDLWDELEDLFERSPGDAISGSEVRFVSESALLKAVAHQPISVSIDAGGSAFRFYSSGVFTGDCGTELDHGVTAVAYGTTSDGTKYWLEGYIRMQRDIDAKEASQVTSRKLQQEVSLSERHEQWMFKYRKRKKDDNVEFIESFNAAGNKPYKLSSNTTRKSNIYYGLSTTDIRGPFFINRRKKGAVTPIKNQGLCGSRAFSTVVAIEGISKLTTSKLVCLSKQEIVSCEIEGEHQGCSGGGSNYPYNAIETTCNKEKEASHVAKISGYERVPANCKLALPKAVAHQLVSVSTDAGGSACQFYSSGVFIGNCGTKLDLGASVVGYDVHLVREIGLDYFYGIGMDWIGLDWTKLVL
ncbi:hypothetical protein ACOSQ3_002262 [Xanthoceras sorbifolium]